MKNKLIYIGVLSFLFPTICYAIPSAPPSNNHSSSVTYNGAYTITSAETNDSKTYESTTASQNALLVKSGTSTINACTITKSGDSTDENADFYGTNAGILVYNGASLNIKGGKIITNGSHANAVFAYTNGTINIEDTEIKTTGNNSGGIMVTGGGILNATNLNVVTSGNSSASIRSDRGGGNLTVTKGTYETNGVGSPAIYSTANIKVNDASLTSTSSEGVVIEGANSVTLNNTKLTDTNNSLNGNSETYKNIFIYQSMSGDASEGSGTFNASDSEIITNKGDTIFVTNTTALINLTNNNITNNVGSFIRIQSGKWGNSGSNGGNVTLNLDNQKVKGDIIVDSISKLSLSLKNNSKLETTIDNANQSSNTNLTISKDSILILTNDSYIDSLTNEVSDNSNIYLNGHSLYVGGTKVNANNKTYIETSTTTASSNKETTTTNNNLNYIAIGISILILLIAVVIISLKRRNK